MQVASINNSSICRTLLCLFTGADICNSTDGFLCKCSQNWAFAGWFSIRVLLTYNEALNEIFFNFRFLWRFIRSGRDCFSIQLSLSTVLCLAFSICDSNLCRIQKSHLIEGLLLAHKHGFRFQIFQKIFRYMMLFPWVWGSESLISCRDKMTVKTVIESQGETCSTYTEFCTYKKPSILPVVTKNGRGFQKIEILISDLKKNNQGVADRRHL